MLHNPAYTLAGNDEIDTFSPFKLHHIMDETLNIKFNFEWFLCDSENAVC